MQKTPSVTGGHFPDPGVDDTTKATVMCLNAGQDYAQAVLERAHKLGVDIEKDGLTTYILDKCGQDPRNTLMALRQADGRLSHTK